MQAFRRAESPGEAIRVKLRGMDPTAVYALTNLDVAGTTMESLRPKNRWTKTAAHDQCSYRTESPWSRMPRLPIGASRSRYGALR